MIDFTNQQTGSACLYEDGKTWFTVEDIENSDNSVVIINGEHMGELGLFRGDIVALQSERGKRTVSCVLTPSRANAIERGKIRLNKVSE